VVAWGFSDYGQCFVPLLPGGLNYQLLAGGGYHSLAIRSDWNLMTWGLNGNGQCIVPSLPSGLRYDAVAGGETHTLALIREVDCDQNGIDDFVDIASGALDCDSNTHLDVCDVAGGFAPDCNFNNIPDSCDLATGTPDCNLNSIPDICDIGSGTSIDANFDSIPDECTLDCNNNGLLDTAELAAGLALDCNLNYIPDTCDSAVAGADCNGNSIPDTCEGFGDCDGDQILDVCETDTNGDAVPDDCQDGGTPYCFGVGPAGGGVACPCGNIGTAGNGCPNSQNPSGARLEAVGLPSRVADSLLLRGSGMPASASVLYFQGTLQSNGQVFGDGLRCAVGLTARLGNTFNFNGASQWPPAGGVPIHTAGQIPATAAATRYYQGWYRDASATFCTLNRFNLTNGVAVVWVP
jgi:hypothetical protein